MSDEKQLKWLDPKTPDGVRQEQDRKRPRVDGSSQMPSEAAKTAIIANLTRLTEERLALAVNQGIQTKQLSVGNTGLIQWSGMTAEASNSPIAHDKTTQKVPPIAASSIPKQNKPIEGRAEKNLEHTILLFSRWCDDLPETTHYELLQDITNHPRNVIKSDLITAIEVGDKDLIEAFKKFAELGTTDREFESCSHFRNHFSKLLSAVLGGSVTMKPDASMKLLVCANLYWNMEKISKIIGNDDEVDAMPLVRKAQKVVREVLDDKGCVRSLVFLGAMLSPLRKELEMGEPRGAPWMV